MASVVNPEQSKGILEQSSTPSLGSFENTYRTAYSHGLENIYQLETVDITTVRPIRKFLQKKEKSPVQEVQILHRVQQQQLEFDFGDHYRDWMEPFLLREPIQVLGLSHGAESCLLQHGKDVLRSLVGEDLNHFVFLKGMGQGYIDEIERQLHAYLQGKSFETSYVIEFRSWLRSLTAELDRKKVVVCLASFGIDRLFSLSRAENAAIRRVDTATRQKWIEEIIESFRSADQRFHLQEDVCTVANVFLIPWIRARGGVVSQEELLERVCRVSDSTAVAACALQFFCQLMDGASPFLGHLHRVEDDLWCSDRFYAELYPELIQRVLTYFYQPSISYKLSDLIVWISRECARHWQNIPEKFMISALRRSSLFRVRKGVSGKLEIRRSWTAPPNE